MTFLDRAARTPFVWGQSDCMLEVADWLDFACNVGAAARWRGTYTDEASLNVLLEPLGGFEAAMQSEAVTLGLEEVLEGEVPTPGDVALVTVAGQDKPLGAILMPSGRWRMKTLDGVVLTRDVIIVRAWRLPCRP